LWAALLAPVIVTESFTDRVCEATTKVTVVPVAVDEPEVKEVVPKLHVELSVPYRYWYVVNVLKAGLPEGPAVAVVNETLVPNPVRVMVGVIGGWGSRVMLSKVALML
jgi:hypothetical protein